MKIVVLGAGALGSILAGHLARAGEDVTLLARGERATYLKENGITVTGLVDFNTPCVIATDPGEISGADLLIVTVKTQDTDAALSSLAHATFSSVISVQNGVRYNARLAAVFSDARTVGSSASFSGEISSNGDARFTVNAGFFIGELPDGLSDRARNISASLQNAGINSEVTANIRVVQWSKFAAFAAAAPVSILTRLVTYKWLSNPGSALIFARIVREIAATAAIQGIQVEDSPPFPIKSMVGGSEEEAVSLAQEMGAHLEVNAPEHRISVLQDLERGRKLELDDTLGYVVDEAHRLGVPAPTLESCYSLCTSVNQNI